MIYVQWFICQCKCKELTEKQAAKKEAAAARREKRHGTEKGNSGKEQCNLHLISKARGKKTKLIIVRSKCLLKFLPTIK